MASDLLAPLLLKQPSISALYIVNTNRHKKKGYEWFGNSFSYSIQTCWGKTVVDFIPLSWQTLNWVKNSITYQAIKLPGLSRTGASVSHSALQVFVSDSRINVYIDVDTWVLVLYKVVPADEATYECHVNADPPQKVAIHLFVKGECVFSVLSPLPDWELSSTKYHRS